MTSAVKTSIAALALALTACATPAPEPDPPPPPDPQLAAELADSETGAAVGLLTTPAAVSVYKWLGQAILQILINTKIDIKVEASTEAKKAPE